MTRPSWMPDELAIAGRENLDAQHVAEYDAKEDADAAAEVVLLRGLGLAATDTLVELGAGTGQLTVAVAPYVAHVVAVDVSAPMRARLARKVEHTGLPNVRVVDAGFLTYRHVGPPADVVYSRLALHHLPDTWKAVALARVHRMLRPGGVFRLVDVVYHFPAAELADRVEAWAARYEGAEPGQWTRADVEEHVRDEHSTFTWLLEAMLRRAGFLVERAEYTDDLYAAYVLRARASTR